MAEGLNVYRLMQIGRVYNYSKKHFFVLHGVLHIIDIFW